MSRKEVPRAGLLKAALAGKISNAQGAEAVHGERPAVSTGEGPVRGRGPARPAAPAARPAGAPPAAAGRRAHPRGRVAPEHLRRRSTTAMPPRSCGRSRACCSAGPPCAACAAPSACPPSGSAGAARSAPGGRRKPRAAPSCSSTPVSSRGSRRAAPNSTLHGAIDDATRHRRGPALPAHRGSARLCHPAAAARHHLRPAPGPLWRSPQRLCPQRSALDVAEQLRGRQDPTHFGRILRELGIGYIAAGSPQAKGRIERLWRTLQDRLVIELRLRGIAHPRGRQRVPRRVPRRLQSPLCPRPRRPHRRLAPRPPRFRRPPELSLHPRRRARQHRPPRPPLGPTAAPPLLRRPAPRGARVPGRPAPRLRGRPVPRHAARARRRVHPSPPPQPQRRSRPAPPCLSEPRDRGGPLSPSLPKTPTFKVHLSTRDPAQAEPYAPVAPLHAVFHPKPGDDIFTEQLT